MFGKLQGEDAERPCQERNFHLSGLIESCVSRVATSVLSGSNMKSWITTPKQQTKKTMANTQKNQDRWFQNLEILDHTAAHDFGKPVKEPFNSIAHYSYLLRLRNDVLI
jgi:uncharacterized protein (DUF305 family)